MWRCGQGERWTSVAYKNYNTKVKDANVWLQRGVLQILVVRRKEEKRCRNTGTRRSGGGCDIGRNDKCAKNEDKDCHGKVSREYIFSVCSTSR